LDTTSIPPEQLARSASAASDARHATPRVLLLTPRLLDSAGGRACTDLALGLTQRGFEPVVCCYAGWGPLAAELAAAGVEIFPLKLRSGIDPGFAWALAQELRERRIEVVHTFNARRAFVFGVLGAMAARVRVAVATFREEPPQHNPWLRRLGRLCGELVGTVIATSDEVATELVHQRWIPPGKALVVRDGVRIERFHEAARRAPARAHWGIEPDVPLVGAVLQPSERAEEALLLQAFAELRRRVPRAQLVVCGRRGSGEGWRGLGPYVDSPAFYSALDALCVPIEKGSVPLNLLESLAAGLPVAASRGEAQARELRAPRGPWAFANLSAPGPIALAAALEELLLERDSARALMREGASLVREDFGIDAHVERIARLYAGE